MTASPSVWRLGRELRHALLAVERSLFHVRFGRDLTTRLRAPDEHVQACEAFERVVAEYRTALVATHLDGEVLS